MATVPKHPISAEIASDLLKSGRPLVNMLIKGEVKLITDHEWDKEVIFDTCEIESFDGSVTHFNKPVRLMNCHFEKCRFIFSYFLKGLIIDNCTFDTALDFQAGGHNKPGYIVAITNNTFHGFVNFFDCWYENEVIINSNRFQEGTNLLGKPLIFP